MIQTLRTISEVAHLRRAAKWSPDALQRWRDRRLTALVRHACATVPFYRELYARAGVDPCAVRGEADLHRLPIVRKSDLQAQPAEAITSTAFHAADLVTEQTTGSSGRPLAVRFERRWRAVSRALFLRVLTAAGHRPGAPALLLTAVDRPSRRAALGLRYVSYKQDHAAIVAALEEHRPELVYGWVTPLRRLALHAREHGVRHRPRRIVTTAEALDEPTRRLLGEVFDAQVTQMYGLTEMGAVGFQCGRCEGFHLADETVIVESHAQAHDSGPPRLVMTNLRLRAMPLIRYETGDCGVVLPPARCGCGRWGRQLQRVEGRLVDCLRAADGRRVLPYELTTELEKVPAVGRFRVVQDRADHVTVEVEPASRNYCNGTATAAEAAIRAAVRGVLGESVLVDVAARASLDPGPGRKFRVVECRLPREESES